MPDLTKPVAAPEGAVNRAILSHENLFGVGKAELLRQQAKARREAEKLRRESSRGWAPL